MRTVIGLVLMLGLAGSAFAYDVNRYLIKKASGTIKIFKTGSGYAVSEKRYDPETGTQLADSVTGVTIAELTTQRDALQAQIDQINQMIADLQATP